MSPAVTSWGHPIGEAVVYISPSGTRLARSTPARSATTISRRSMAFTTWTLLPPSGPIAFVVDTGERRGDLAVVERWRGTVRSSMRSGDDFGALAFTADGGTLLYAAVHAEMRRSFMRSTSGTDDNQGWWRGRGRPDSSIDTQPDATVS